jgi:Carboxypeptidase regulatory-like domain
MRVLFGLLALASLPAAPQIGPDGLPPQQQTPAGTDCAVDGYVVNAVTGEPVPRARVTLDGPAGQSFLSTDNSGRWSFSNVACGPIRMMVSRPGFLNGAPSSTNVLTSGTPLHGITMRLTPTSVIAGKVTDDQGDPVMNAPVAVLTSRIADGGRTFQVTGNTNTNDLGEFRIPGLNAGKYIVCARSNQRGGGDPVMLGESCYPGPAGDTGAANAIDLSAGREMRVDFTLRQVSTVHVRGVISGLPKPQGVALTLVRRGVNNPSGATPARITPDGKFDVAWVAPGSYILSTDYFESGARFVARVPVEVGDADLDDIPVHLDSGFTINGTVRTESKSGGASDRQFSIVLKSSDPLFGVAPARWGPDHSTFSIADMMPGNYRLDATPPGKFFVKSATLAGRDLLAGEVSINQSAGPIDLVLSDDGGTIDALVSDPADQPAPGSWIMVFPQGRQIPRIAMTGPDGHARLQGLAPGAYRIYAWDDVRQVEYANPVWMQRYETNGASLTVQASQTTQTALREQIVPAQ